jgi:hypothetical protein
MKCDSYQYCMGGVIVSDQALRRAKTFDFHNQAACRDKVQNNLSPGIVGLRIIPTSTWILIHDQCN